MEKYEGARISFRPENKSCLTQIAKLRAVEVQFYPVKPRQPLDKFEEAIIQFR